MRNGQNGGRRRGRGGAPRPASGGSRSPDIGNRMEVRQRGNAHQLLEKYKSLARDASTQGDRVSAEYYLQYADHYYRVLNDYRLRQEEAQRVRARDYDDVEDGEQEIAEESVEAATEEEQQQPSRPAQQRRQRHAAAERHAPVEETAEMPAAEQEAASSDGADAPTEAASEDGGARRRRRGRGRPRRDAGDDAAPEMAMVDA